MLFSYQPLTQAVSRDQWKADFQSAERIKNVRFGEKLLHLGRMAELGGRYIPYTDIVRWFVSVEAATGGDATFHIYRLVVNYGTEGEWFAELGEVSANLNEKTPLKEVTALMNRYSHIPQGRDYSRPSKFRIT